MGIDLLLHTMNTLNTNSKGSRALTFASEAAKKNSDPLAAMREGKNRLLKAYFEDFEKNCWTIAANKANCEWIRSETVACFRAREGDWMKNC